MPFELQDSNKIYKIIDRQRDIGVGWKEKYRNGSIDFRPSIADKLYIVRVHETIDVKNNKYIWTIEKIFFPLEFLGDRKAVQSVALEGVQEFVRITRSKSRARIEVAMNIK